MGRTVTRVGGSEDVRGKESELHPGSECIQGHRFCRFRGSDLQGHVSVSHVLHVFSSVSPSSLVIARPGFRMYPRHSNPIIPIHDSLMKHLKTAEAPVYLFLFISILKSF